MKNHSMPAMQIKRTLRPWPPLQPTQPNGVEAKSRRSAGQKSFESRLVRCFESGSSELSLTRALGNRPLPTPDVSVGCPHQPETLLLIARGIATCRQQPQTTKTGNSGIASGPGLRFHQLRSACAGTAALGCPVAATSAATALLSLPASRRRRWSYRCSPCSPRCHSLSCCPPLPVA